MEEDGHSQHLQEIVRGVLLLLRHPPTLATYLFLGKFSELGTWELDNLNSDRLI